MIPFFASLAREDDWTGYLWFIVFVVLPIAARILKALFVRLGLLREEEPAKVEPEGPRGRSRQLRDEQRRAEDQGRELWRRLAAGEVSAPPPAVPPPVPVPSPARETSLELEEEPQPLSVMGEVSEPGEAPEVSLEQELEPAPLAALATPGVAQEVGPETVRPSPAAFVLARGDLRRAIVLSEILGPPVSERAGA